METVLRSYFFLFQTTYILKVKEKINNSSNTNYREYNVRFTLNTKCFQQLNILLYKAESTLTDL